MNCTITDSFDRLIDLIEENVETKELIFFRELMLTSCVGGA